MPSVNATPETRDYYDTLKDRYAPNTTQSEFLHDLLEAYEDRQEGGVHERIDVIRERQELAEMIRNIEVKTDVIFEHVTDKQ